MVLSDCPAAAWPLAAPPKEPKMTFASERFIALHISTVRSDPRRANERAGDNHRHVFMANPVTAAARPVQEFKRK